MARRKAAEYEPQVIKPIWTLEPLTKEERGYYRSKKTSTERASAEEAIRRVQRIPKRKGAA